jgi:formate dehydrogenase assembly factor FdhD
MNSLSNTTPETTTPTQTPSILPASTLSAAELKQQLSAIKMNKENAIKLIVFYATLKKFSDKAKEYLSTKCEACDDGNYTAGQMSLKHIQGSKTTYTNDKIKKFEEQIKAEREKIKANKSKGEIIETKYNSFKVQY